jgi:photosynthetic reaction center H subunit
MRSDTPDISHDGKAKIVPLRVATDFGVAEGDINPVGLRVVGFDLVVAGTFPTSGWTAPNRCCAISKSPRKWAMRRGRSWCRSISASSARPGWRAHLLRARLRGEQFASVPGTKQPTASRFLEEDKITAYFGSGLLYADPSRQEPLA